MKLIPDELQGRVNSVFRLLAFGFFSLGQVLIGILLQNVGACSPFLFIASGLIALAVAIIISLQIRRAGNFS